MSARVEENAKSMVGFHGHTAAAALAGGKILKTAVTYHEEVIQPAG
jgi:hypothetical protein